MWARGTYVADGVVCDVDAILEETLGTRLTRCGSLVGADDLFRNGLYNVFSIEVEDLLVLLPVVILLLPLVVEVLLAVLDVLLLVLVFVGPLVVWLGRRSGDCKGGCQESNESGG
jgi:hypothetical protein